MIIPMNNKDTIPNANMLLANTATYAMMKVGIIRYTPFRPFLLGVKSIPLTSCATPRRLVAVGSFIFNVPLVITIQYL